MKSRIIFIVIIIILVFIIIGVGGNSYQSTPTSSSSKEATYKDMVKVYNLKAGDTVKSPFELKGEVRGSWTFEANLPIEVVTQTGQVLLATSTLVSGEWTTSDYIPFSKVLVFNVANTADGFIIIKKDNPSGLAQYEDSFKIPVHFEK